MNRLRRMIMTMVAAVTVLLLPGYGQAQTRIPISDEAQGDRVLSPFYVWEGNIPARPGQLLRSEPLPRAASLLAARENIRILYSSTDGVGGKVPIVVSGAVYIPKGKPPAGGWPIIAWGHGTLGIGDGCAPSWQGRAYRDIAYLSRWLNEGFAVVATDYQGLGVPGPNPALNNRSNAYTLLDSLRAAFKLSPSLSNRVVLVGQSQGGAAVIATAGYGPSYAPDIHILGAIATGAMYTPPYPLKSAPVDLNKVEETIAYQYYSVLAAQQIDSSLQASEIFTPRGEALFEHARSTCVIPLEADVVLAGLTRANALKPGAQARLASWWSDWQRFPTLKFAQPVFVSIGTDDPGAPGQRALIKDACAAGTTIEAHVYPGRDHSGTVNLSLDDSVPFARRLIAGEHIVPRCAVD
ncbi:alpha/beta hydrolase [Sphingomonas paeninsulae]|uniref:Alpha/beta hydrolase n=1 Tax=Sphingomonas paeninsulae TaxID=2319844 RepID=A0A494TKS3_SPHPE|nr:alpha/beta hydrolase [Sphingomonas paeninsulae]AYJ88144.1 alpha/beta hydrolase [Sphingomonas paeninsulae]